MSQLIPYSEYRPDVADYQSPYSANLLNVLPRGDGYGPVKAFGGYSAALASQCRGFFKALKTDGSVSIFAGTSNKLYQMNNSTGAWTDVSLGSSTYSALPSTDNWQFVQFGNFVIAVQVNASPQVFDLTSSTNFANLGGSPPAARYISVINRFVVLSGLSSTPYRIQWSGLNDVTQWTSGLEGSDFQDLPDGGIVRGVGGGEFGNIYQDTTVRRMTFMPGSAFVFQIQRIAEDVGMYSAGSLIKAAGRQFFYSTSGFQMIDATGQLTPIGKERVDRTFLASLDVGNLQLFIGASDPRTSRVYWAYKSNSGVAGAFDTILWYDWALDRWGPINVMGEYLGSLGRPGITLEGLDSISSSIDALGPSLDSFAIAGTPELTIFNTSHVLGFFSGTNLEATFDTAEFDRVSLDGNAGGMYFRGWRPITDAAGVAGSLLYRANQSTTATVSNERIMDTHGMIAYRRAAHFAKMRDRFPAGTTWTYAKGVIPDVEPSGTHG
jgi:hypothetical protein